MYKYWGFGLNIISPFEMPELLVHDFSSSPNVTICFDKTPSALLSDGITNMVGLQISPTEYLLKVPKVANYYAANGNSIIIEVIPGAEQKSICLFLLLNALPAILNQRDAILLHGAAINYKDGIVLFCGHSGAGKSTLLNLLKREGIQIFSDDICTLNFSDSDKKQIDATASYPTTMLWEDTFNKLGVELPDIDFRVRPQIPKYKIYDSIDFTCQPKLIHKIFFLSVDQQRTELIVEKLSAMQAYIELHNHTYKLKQFAVMNKKALQFKILSKLGADCPVYNIRRPKSSIDSTKQIFDAIKPYLKDDE